MTTAAIRVEGLGKRFRLGERERYVALRDVLARAVKAPFRRRANGNGHALGASHIWALRGVSFDVKEGDTIGIVGRNGAGKSTLLKILAGITLPTEGSAEVRGRVGSLLEVGTGFHPELTGRENIYFSGSILGMKRREIDRKFDEIVAFSGVETFLDTPLKHYSSGMQLRLAFSVAAHLEPEVLLVDEVLAVGDLEFQKKCLGKMEEVTRGGRTVLFVSHNMGAIRRICTRGVWLDRGEVRMTGTAAECVDAYAASVEALETGNGVFDLGLRTDRTGDGRVRMRQLRVMGSAGSPSGTFEFCEPLRFEFDLEAHEVVRACFLGLMINAADGAELVSSCHTDSAEVRELKPGERRSLICDFDQNVLRPGTYSIQASVLDVATWEFCDWFHSIGIFSIDPGTGRFGRVPDGRPGYVQPLLRWHWK
ncbi:MAG TPA: ABC transporter ATP-binding protein [Candidatus Acidoferrales bacterium]|nr:ABC transporter ATP-binding protein [Candidatus Acidoferrales bacterium]